MVVNQRNDLLISRSILEQRLKGAVKGFIYWQTLCARLKQEEESYWSMHQELWCKGEWDESYYSGIQQNVWDASRQIGRYQYEINHCTEELDKIKKRLGL